MNYFKKFFALSIAVTSLFLFSIFLSNKVSADFTPGAFVTKWHIPEDGYSLGFSFDETYSYDFDIDWGDETYEENKNGAIIFHVYATAGDYYISITGTFQKNMYPRPGLVSVEQWGDIVWQNMDFRGPFGNVIFNATDSPVFGTSSSLSDAFSATLFNQDISSWNVSNVTDMSSMFNGATSFNQDISSWNVSNVTNMRNMFAGAASFNQDISSWNVSNVTTMDGMLSDSGISRENYDKLLSAWSLLTLKNNVSLGARGIKYHMAKLDRQRIINDFNWTITGDNRAESIPTEIPDSLIPGAFVFDAEITNTSSPVILPFASIPSYNYNYNIDWGDGSSSFYITSSSSNDNYIGHTYPEAGEYRISITGDIPSIMLNPPLITIKSIEQWGDIKWQTMNSAFRGISTTSSVPTINATDTPDLSNVTDMSNMFASTSFNQDISSWDVSNVTDMSSMFNGATSFNQDISSWNVSNVTNMRNMFAGAASFNQDISSWDVSNVTDMSNMFGGTSLSTENYDKLLNAWSLLPLQSNVNFSAGNTMFLSSFEARQKIINDFRWTITDGGTYNPTLTGVNWNNPRVTITLDMDIHPSLHPTLDNFTITQRGVSEDLLYYNDFDSIDDVNIVVGEGEDNFDYHVSDGVLIVENIVGDELFFSIDPEIAIPSGSKLHARIRANTNSPSEITLTVDGWWEDIDVPSGEWYEVELTTEADRSVFSIALSNNDYSDFSLTDYVEIDYIAIGEEVYGSVGASLSNLSISDNSISFDISNPAEQPDVLYYVTYRGSDANKIYSLNGGVLDDFSEPLYTGSEEDDNDDSPRPTSIRRVGSRRVTPVAIVEQVTQNPTIIGTPEPTTPKQTPTTQKQYNFGQSLISQGHRGETVKELQRFLNNNLNLNLQEDGVFGQKTKEAVTLFQKSQNLKADGVVGPETKAKMLGGTTENSLSSSNLSTLDIQRYLNQKLNLNLTEDGIFGPKTKEAVKLFQRTHNLKEDGIVGPETMSKMGE